MGKDDFWAALQSNYNFIMDSNMVDSCREARGELEAYKIEAANVLSGEKVSLKLDQKLLYTIDGTWFDRWFVAVDIALA